MTLGGQAGAVGILARLDAGEDLMGQLLDLLLDQRWVAPSIHPRRARHLGCPSGFPAPLGRMWVTRPPGEGARREGAEIERGIHLPQ